MSQTQNDVKTPSFWQRRSIDIIRLISVITTCPIYIVLITDIVASFTKEVNPRLPKSPLKTNGRLANHRLTSLVKEATDNMTWKYICRVSFVT